MFCVCRGKLSEGIDFKDKLCRGVIFIGIPKMSFGDPAHNQKELFMNKFHKQFKNDWQDIDAAKAVNQALGRAVRHKYDYGSIILIDQRYIRSTNSHDTTVTMNISSWIRTSW